MAELNFKQITDKLNAEFTGEVRRLIFWYDADAEFADDVDTLQLDNAKVLHLERDNQFYTKYFLECVDRETNYLVYAPFAKPDIRENHLADTIRYSREFFADRASLLTLDLGIDERLKPVIQHYIKFFGDKKRTQAFYALEIEAYNRSVIEVAMMAVLCKCKTPSFEEVVRSILTDEGVEENKYLAEFERYDLLTSFWQHCESVFGYADAKPSLEKFVMMTFVTHIADKIPGDVPQAWKPFVSFKPGNVVTFLDNLMNSYLYAETFDRISDDTYQSLNAASVLSKLPVESLGECCAFAGIDKLIIDWMIARLKSEDVEAKLNQHSIPEICAARRKMHFGKAFRSEYFIAENAYYLIKQCKTQQTSDFGGLVKRYLEQDYQIDRRYRYFYYYFDQLEDTASFEGVRELVENIYTNEYLNRLVPNWTQAFAQNSGKTSLVRQNEFYGKYVRNVKERVVVIISDAMRYEVGRSLLEKLQADEKCKATITAMQAVLPSITRFGMAALLPHRELELKSDGTALVDGSPCIDLKQREAVLLKHQENARCVQYDDIKNMKVAELREIFAGQNVVYVYHNQIDARGDRPNTENEVFASCEEAVEEIFALIKRLTTSANTIRYIVTADHGFIYKRDKLTESDKITGFTGAGKRYLISDQNLTADGVEAVSMASLYGKQDERMVYFPVSADIFKAPGAGLNYVHGGCSPQEMIIPVIDVKTEKGHKDTTFAQLTLVSLTNKITNLITSLDFLQKEPVSDVVKETKYRVFFISDAGEKISSEHVVTADRKDKDATKRMFRLRFTFKNKKYEKSRKYYLVIHDDKNDLEILRHEIVMDLAFADDFGFGF